MVGLSNDFAVDDFEIIVALAARQTGTFKANTKFHAFHSGDSIDNLGNAAFYAAEHRFTDARGKAGNGTFDDAAHAIPGGTGLSNAFLHGLAGIGVQHGEICGDRFDFRVRGFKVTVATFADGQNMGTDATALCRISREDLSSNWCSPYQIHF